MPVPSKKGSKL